MLQINCVIVQKLKDRIDGLVLDDITYKVKSIHALIMDVEYDCQDGEKAKVQLRKYLEQLPEMQAKFLSIKVTDEMGNII